MLETFEPRNQIERIQCALNPAHPFTNEQLTSSDKKRLEQYQIIYRGLLQKDRYEMKTKDVQKAIIDELNITKSMYFKLLAATKKLFHYDPQQTEAMRRAVQIEQLEHLYQIFEEDYTENPYPKMANNLIALRKYIIELENQGDKDGINMQEILEQLQRPQHIVITNNNAPNVEDITAQ